MKKIVVMPVKNEEWILERTLSCLSLWADHIIVADQGSTDLSLEIYKKFPSVIVIKNENKNYNEHQRRQVLLDAARNFDGYNLIFNLAADEIVSAEMLNSNNELEKILNSKIGTCFDFRWVHLWRSESVYREDGSIWAKARLPCAFIDDRVTGYKTGYAHLARVPEQLIPNLVKVEEPVVLHYQFVDWENMLIKQRWARLLEFEHYYTDINFLKLSLKLNLKYYITKDERWLVTRPLKSTWYKGYPLIPIKKNKDIWRNEESLKRIAKLGANSVKWLDIWDVEWENIKDPRCFLQKTYHFLQPAVATFVDSMPKAAKILIKKLFE